MQGYFTSLIIGNAGGEFARNTHKLKN